MPNKKKYLDERVIVSLHSRSIIRSHEQFVQNKRKLSLTAVLERAKLPPTDILDIIFKIKIQILDITEMFLTDILNTDKRSLLTFWI